MTLPDHTLVQALPSCQFSNISVTTERPPLTRDVNVMTKISSIYPSTSPNDDPAPSTPLTPLSDLPYHSKDLATNILGVQFNGRADSQPYYHAFGRVKKIYVKQTPIRSDISPSFQNLILSHRNMLSTYISTVGISTQKRYVILLQKRFAKGNASSFVQLKNLSQRSLILTDVEKCTRDYTHPHIEGTIKEFINNLDDPNSIQFILDLPYSGAGIPESLRWNQTTAEYPIVDPVHPDNFLVNGWALAHHPAVLTNFHHDSDGGITFVQSVLGKKMWITAFPKNPSISRTKFSEHSLELTNTPINPDKIKANWDIEVVTLEEGDMLIQPPGQYHAMRNTGNTLQINYMNTPSTCFIEWSFIYPAHLPIPQGFFTRPLIALCMMVIESNKYVASGSNKKKSLHRSTTKPAVEICNAIVKYFWKDMKSASSVYVNGPCKTRRHQSLTCPGELINRQELAICLQPYTKL
ncbi:hypothetical protein BDR07DRAFT_1381280 [Suillus spraguei]|nr:hypothetical protein BDR07DRAFT_1381280 [Suillus spraguei]